MTTQHSPGNIGPVRLPGRGEENAGIEIHVRQGAYLPHWNCEGGVYAVTFRLADSLPQGMLAAWTQERNEILRRAVQGKRTLTPNEIQRLAELHSERVEKFLDQGHGECHFKNPRAAQIMRDALLHFDGQRYNLVVWCVMPNHVHVVVHPRKGFELSDICHSWKSFTANQINDLLGRTGTLWQPEPYDHLIRDQEDYRHAVEYFLDNPIAAGLIDWPWVGRGLGYQAVTDAIFGLTSHGQDGRATRFVARASSP